VKHISSFLNFWSFHSLQNTPLWYRNTYWRPWSHGRVGNIPEGVYRVESSINTLHVSWWVTHLTPKLAKRALWSELLRCIHLELWTTAPMPPHATWWPWAELTPPASTCWAVACPGQYRRAPTFLFSRHRKVRCVFELHRFMFAVFPVEHRHQSHLPHKVGKKAENNNSYPNRWKFPCLLGSGTSWSAWADRGVSLRN
jgi:hypothetical protein